MVVTLVVFGAEFDPSLPLPATGVKVGWKGESPADRWYKSSLAFILLLCAIVIIIQRIPPNDQ